MSPAQMKRPVIFRDPRDRSKKVTCCRIPALSLSKTFFCRYKDVGPCSCLMLDLVPTGDAHAAHSIFPSAMALMLYVLPAEPVCPSQQGPSVSNAALLVTEASFAAFPFLVFANKQSCCEPVCRHSMWWNACCFRPQRMHLWFAMKMRKCQVLVMLTVSLNDAHANCRLTGRKMQSFAQMPLCWNVLWCDMSEAFQNPKDPSWQDVIKRSRGSQ